MSLLRGFLLLICAGLSFSALSTTIPKQSYDKQKNNIKPHHIIIIYSPTSSFQTEITDKLSNLLITNHRNIKILKYSPDNTHLTKSRKVDLVVAIGINSIKIAEKSFPDIKKLLISTDPGKYKLKIKSGNQNAILYMTQPYCRQLHFIKLINGQWNSVGYLYNEIRAVDKISLQQCAKKYHIKLYGINTEGSNYLSESVKDALKHADVLLALPNKYIYNSTTVKDILLTSYRYRKPVIAFSKNFVTAGALASIYSKTDEISQAAYRLIEHFLRAGYQFKKTVNYPAKFNISINSQVFMALGLKLPDLNNIKNSLFITDKKTTGNIK